MFGIHWPKRQWLTTCIVYVFYFIHALMNNNFFSRLQVCKYVWMPCFLHNALFFSFLHGCEILVFHSLKPIKRHWCAWISKCVTRNNCCRGYGYPSILWKCAWSKWSFWTRDGIIHVQSNKKEKKIFWH